MKINRVKNNNELTLKLIGRLDTSTSPDLDAAVKESIGDITSLIFDFEELEYVSSAGLRVLLSTQKAMTRKGGSMKVIHVSDLVMEVFEVTGFSEILTIE